MRRKAFSLVLVVVLTGLIGITLAVVARSFRGSIVQGRLDELEIRASQMVASGQAWAYRHPEGVRAIRAEVPLELPVLGLLPEGMSGRLVIERASEEDARIVARVEDGRRVSRCTARIRHRDR